MCLSQRRSSTYAAPQQKQIYLWAQSVLTLMKPCNILCFYANNHLAGVSEWASKWVFFPKDGHLVLEGNSAIYSRTLAISKWITFGRQLPQPDSSVGQGFPMHHTQTRCSNRAIDSQSFLLMTDFSSFSNQPLHFFIVLLFMLPSPLLSAIVWSQHHTHPYSHTHTHTLYTHCTSCSLSLIVSLFLRHIVQKIYNI